MLIKIYPDNPNPKQVARVVDILKNDGVIIYPTDTVYALGCDVFNAKAVDRLATTRGKKIEKADFSFIFPDLSNLAEYTKPLDNKTFKLMKKNLPGPFTFVLNANNRIPKLFKNKKKTLGVRIPDNPVILEIVKKLGNPILTTSVHDDDEVIEYTTDPELIHEKYEKIVDCVVDGGFGKNEASTVIDCTAGGTPVILRQGIGLLEGA
jgi:tRNA threonylcarbamoyl adenosine modification protein (Sua5/YciO/YrdC/YwlC family)